MTREEAIKGLKTLAKEFSGYKPNEEMFDMAIKALERSECEDAVPRESVEYICRKNTVSTNPYNHEYHEKFIQFMDDPEISDFGRWQHSNGFNTALVAVKCDLDKVPSVTPKRKKSRWVNVNDRNVGYCESCLARGRAWMNFCPNCGADMREGEQS